MSEKYYKPYFENKNCDICKGRATKFRQITIIGNGGKGFMLCDSEKCDLLTLLKVGWKKEDEINLEKIN